MARQGGLVTWEGLQVISVSCTALKPALVRSAHSRGTEQYYKSAMLSAQSNILSLYTQHFFCLG